MLRNLWACTNEHTKKKKNAKKIFIYVVWGNRRPYRERHGDQEQSLHKNKARKKAMVWCLKCHVIIFLKQRWSWSKKFLKEYPIILLVKWIKSMGHKYFHTSQPVIGFVINSQYKMWSESIWCVRVFGDHFSAISAEERKQKHERFLKKKLNTHAKRYTLDLSITTSKVIPHTQTFVWDRNCTRSKSLEVNFSIWRVCLVLKTGQTNTFWWVISFF